MKALTFLLSILTILSCTAARAQYAPQAGLPGSTAIQAGGPFEAWGTGCTLQRGYMNIASPALGYASVGDSTDAIGPANGSVVSLGDSGVADITFATPITNGEGDDFAVFENGFLDPINDSTGFLELAFVEVSSDGVNYFRFPATSLTQQTVQADNNTYLYANQLNNLAGKYVNMYGTPFDLQELSGNAALDINNVTHVRIIDVVGSIGAHASHDSAGRAINDPYPTPYPSCGFDLDAVGVLHEVGFTTVKTISDNVAVTVYPNPATDKLFISIKGNVPADLSATLTTISGTLLQQLPITQNTTALSVTQYPTGMYYLEFHDANGNKWVEKVTRR